MRVRPALGPAPNSDTCFTSLDREEPPESGISNMGEERATHSGRSDFFGRIRFRALIHRRGLAIALAALSEPVSFHAS